MTESLRLLTTLVERLDSGVFGDSSVIRWASPVPSFGDHSLAQVATLGLNPSNREFVDSDGRELEGSSRRFHTLTSLGLSSWADADVRHLRLILASCSQYFTGNPYDRWFRVLDQVLIGAGVSYYDSARLTACHLDLIPYATTQKWTVLPPLQRRSLLRIAGTDLASLVARSEIDVLILNGQSVIDHFSETFGVSLGKREMPEWDLARATTRGVPGFAYEGVINELAAVELGRPVTVLGFNHNLQSSYGITTKVIQRIGRWVAEALMRNA